MDNLWKHTLWKNPKIKFINNAEIIEYDMKNAGFSLIKKYKLLPENKIDELEKLGNRVNPIDKKFFKRKRDEEIGKLQRDNKAFSEALNYAFELARKDFITENKLTEDDIISIKKDAIFVITRGRKINGKIDEFVNFRKKNEYTSYFSLSDGKIEIYINFDKVTDIKGISDDNVKLHENYFIKFITNVFYKLEAEEYNSVVIFIANFIEKYKSRTLDISYYREFNPMSKYRYLDGETTSIDYKEDVNEIDISHNYSIITDLLLCVIINHKSELYKKGGKKWN